MNWQQFKKVLAFYGRFTLSFTQIGYRARSLLWKPCKADFHGQRWLVTGASGGLGRQIALAAARDGAQVTIAARNRGKLEQVVAEGRALGLQLQVAVCDFSLQRDTARLIDEMQRGGQPFDVLVNNVGVLNDDHTLTSEGRETSFVINLLSHYHLTESLIRRGLLAGPRPLVINVTSGGGYNVPLSTAMLNKIDPATFNGTAAYGFHKRAQMVLTQAWNEKHRAQGIAFYVMHPGWADTEGVQRSLPRFRRILRPVLRDAVSGSDTVLWLAATRPAQSGEELVWFDRKPRTAHVYERTRVTKESGASLMQYLDVELARVSDALP
jgi:dehydrogenase/reductase SDR family protein 12